VIIWIWIDEFKSLVLGAFEIRRDESFMGRFLLGILAVVGLFERSPPKNSGVELFLRRKATRQG
jgi:hypothetical protein